MLPGPPAGPSKPQAEAPVSTEGPGSGHSAALRLPPIRGQAPRSDLLSSVQSLSHVRTFAIPWTAARQASLSITDSQSLLKLMSIESVTSSHSAFKPSKERAVWPSVQPELCRCRAPHKASSTGGKPLTWEHTHTLTQSPEAVSHFKSLGRPQRKSPHQMHIPKRKSSLHKQSPFIFLSLTI